VGFPPWLREREDSAEVELHEAERARLERALRGDAGAFGEVYDACFRVAWAFSLQLTRDVPRAEEATARALRHTFEDLSGLARAPGSLGRRVVEEVERALRELAAETRPSLGAPPPPGGGG
jgi:class 3 adenylate cyclase